MFITLMPSPHPRENYIVTLPKIHVCLGPLWQTEIFLPLEKIMDPRMMLVGIYRRYEYIGDYRYTHRCTHVTSMFPRWRALSVVNQARTAPDQYDTPGLYTLRGSRLSFP